MKGKGKPPGRGGGSRGGHKGQHRRFTNFDEIEAQQKKLAKQAEWRKQRGDEEDDEDKPEGEESESEESEEESEEEETDSDETGDEERRPKGVESLIEVENPNRILKKVPPALAKAGPSTEAVPQLSRREREEADRQRRAANVSLKTEQARADLARLALIKQQREASKIKREAELKAKEDEKKAKVAEAAKARAPKQ